MSVTPCQPMPGPPDAAWPSARPGTSACFPYPQCCQAAARPATLIARRAPGFLHWLGAHQATAALVTAEAACALAAIITLTAITVSALRARRREHARPPLARAHRAYRPLS